MAKPITIVVVGAGVLAVVLSLMAYSRCNREQPTYIWSQRSLVNRAISLYAAQSGIPREEVIRTSIPVAAKGPTGTCVNLLPPAGAIGFIPIYCFDESQKLIYQGKY